MITAVRASEERVRNDERRVAGAGTGSRTRYEEQEYQASEFHRALSFRSRVYPFTVRESDLHEVCYACLFACVCLRICLAVYP